MTRELPGFASRQTWDVSALLQAAGDALAARFGACAVRGEISGFSRAGSGHCYFTLKDADRLEGALRCCLFRRSALLVDFVPADGQLVELRGRLGVYGPRGELQLVVESMQRSGVGALYEQFLRLQAKLAAEGLFDAALKRPLPAYPQRIGVVTSPDGAALHDVLTALARRAPHVEVVLYPSVVQGPDAPRALCQALSRAGERHEVEVLVVCRGGGSLEDLWAFNDERVVRAVRALPMPVICGVGHETDVTLAELAADLRAPTPTAAAELVSPARQACLDQLAGQLRAMRRRLREAMETRAQRLDRAALRLVRPAESARREAQRLDLVAHRLHGAAHRLLDRRRGAESHSALRLQRATQTGVARQRAALAAAAGRLDALDPQRVLARGYALLTRADGHALVSVHGVASGDRLRAALADGVLDMTVQTVESQPGEG